MMRRATERAMSIPVDPDTGLIGTLKDGDHVDVLIADHSREQQPGVARPLLRNVGRADGADGVRLPRADQGVGHRETKILYAQEYEKLWLVERPEVQAQDSPTALDTTLDDPVRRPRAGTDHDVGQQPEGVHGGLNAASGAGDASSGGGN